MNSHTHTNLNICNNTQNTSSNYAHKQMYTYKKQKHPKGKPLPTTGGAVRTHSCITGGSLPVLGLRGLEGVPDAGLEQCINRLGLVGGGVLERCHHGAVDVGSRVGQVLLWREEGASIAASSLCVCA